MATSAYNKFQDFVDQLMRGVHTFDSDTFKVMLTNVAPVATNAVKADLTEISAGNGYTAGGTATTVTVSETGGVVTVQGTQVDFTATGGTIGSFRYAVLYNDTSANDNLIAWFDYGSSIPLNDGETFSVLFDNAATGNIFTLS